MQINMRRSALNSAARPAACRTPARVAKVASGNGTTAASPGVEAMNKAIGTKIRQAADDFATTQASRGTSLIGKFVGAAARQHAEGRLQLKSTPKAATSNPASPTTPKKLEL